MQTDLFCCNCHKHINYLHLLHCITSSYLSEYFTEPNAIQSQHSICQLQFFQLAQIPNLDKKHSRKMSRDQILKPTSVKSVIPKKIFFEQIEFLLKDLNFYRGDFQNFEK